MTPVPELRVAPDGRVAARTHRVGGPEWSVVAGPDASWLTQVRPTSSEVALWTPMVPALSSHSSGDRAEKLRRQIREYREELAAALGDRSQGNRNMFPLIRDVEALRQQRDALVNEVERLNDEVQRYRTGGDPS